MTIFGRVVQRGDPYTEGLRPFVEVDNCIEMKDQSDFGLFILHYGCTRLNVEIPEDIKQAALTEWEERYSISANFGDNPHYCQEWMHSAVKRKHQIWC